MPFQGISIYDSNSNPILTDGNGSLFITQAPGIEWSVNADLFVNDTPLSVTLFGSPPEAALNVWVANPHHGHIHGVEYRRDASHVSLDCLRYGCRDSGWGLDRSARQCTLDS